MLSISGCCMVSTIISSNSPQTVHESYSHESSQPPTGAARTVRSTPTSQGARSSDSDEVGTEPESRVLDTGSGEMAVGAFVRVDTKLVRALVAISSFVTRAVAPLDLRGHYRVQQVAHAHTTLTVTLTLHFYFYHPAVRHSFSVKYSQYTTALLHGYTLLPAIASLS